MHKFQTIDPASPFKIGAISFRLDPAQAPKSWPKITANTIEGAIEQTSRRYSSLYTELGKMPLGNPRHKPHNPAALDTIFIELTEDIA